MRKTRLLVLILSFGTSISCDKPAGPSLNISNEVYITVLNSEGEDLLDPDHPTKIDITGIRVFYELNGVKTEINRENLDHPSMFLLEAPNANSDYYRILLFLNVEDKAEVTTTYLELDENRSDIFKSKLLKGKFGVDDEKIWLNEQLICDVNKNPGRCTTTIVIN